MLCRMGIEVFVHRDFASYLSSHGIAFCSAEVTEAFPEDVDLLCSVGGDGTFLRSVEWAGSSEVPVLGINTGHLGYLAGFSLDRPAELTEALEGKMDISERMMLRLHCESLPEGFNCCALNEVAVLKGDTTSMVSVRAWLGGDYLADYRADGLIVSTATGSTGYNLSCGGPILEPTLHNMILSPIAPHSLTMRPLVTGSDRSLRLELDSRGEECHVAVDGRAFSVPSRDTVISIDRAPYTTRVALPAGSGFAPTLREKLNWGM